MTKDSPRIQLLQLIQQDSKLLISNWDNLVKVLQTYNIPSISCYEQQQGQELEMVPYIYIPNNDVPSWYGTG